MSQTGHEAPEEGDVPRVHTEDPAEGADPDQPGTDQVRESTEEPAEGEDDASHTEPGGAS
jgi:hypothetical protein